MRAESPCATRSYSFPQAAARPLLLYGGALMLGLGALLAVTVLSGGREAPVRAPGALTAAAPAAPASKGAAFNADGTRVPLFFGYVVFDHDPDAPGGVPGFGPMP